MESEASEVCREENEIMVRTWGRDWRKEIDNRSWQIPHVKMLENALICSGRKWSSGCHQWGWGGGGEIDGLQEAGGNLLGWICLLYRVGWWSHRCVQTSELVKLYTSHVYLFVCRLYHSKAVSLSWDFISELPGGWLWFESSEKGGNLVNDSRL